MIDVDLKTSTVTTQEHTVRLTGPDIVGLLRQELKAQGVKDIPADDAEVEFAVPGGGDWSNCTLDIDGDNPVIVRWTKRTEG